jgi:prepilin-type N-terminal cleavage/methylation domain-containing protein
MTMSGGRPMVPAFHERASARHIRLSRSAARCFGVGSRTGFTLIEVIGALVIFAVGTLMIMQVSGALTTQTHYAGVRSEIVALAAEQVDSIESAPFDSVDAGAVEDTVMVQGWPYVRTVTVTAVTPVLARIEVQLVRSDGLGPSHAVTSYTSDVW